MFKEYDRVPHEVNIGRSSVDSACAVRLLVIGDVGRKLVGDIEFIEEENKRQRILFQAAAQAIEIMKNIHNKGLIHGDIHGSCFAYNDDVQNQEYLDVKLNDLGKPEPFVDTETGNHVVEH